MSRTVPEEFKEQVSVMPEPLTLVVNDATRPSPSSILQQLSGSLPEDTRVLFATGVHRPVLPEESQRILGARLSALRFDRTSNSLDFSEHKAVGTTSAGTEVYLHPWLLEGSVLAVNSVEPHYFAGFTGGRKSILPGCSTGTTIVQNHWLACFPEAAPSRLEGNPVHQDMVEGAGMLEELTELRMINSVSGSERIFCGSAGDSFHRASELSGEVSGIRVSSRYHSLEVRPGGSLEISLYQAMKAVFLWESAVSDGGELVLRADCPEGFGAPQMQGLLAASRSPLRIPSRKEYTLGDHAAVRLSIIRKRIHLSIVTGSGMDLTSLGFFPPENEPGVIIDDAGFTFPLMDGTDA